MTSETPPLDVQPVRPRTPAVILTLIVIFVILHLLRVYGPEGISYALLVLGPFYPDRFGLEGVEFVLAFTGLITHAFLHADWMHLILNSVILAALGRVVCLAMGTGRLLLLMAICAIGGALAQTVLDPSPMIGASGAVFGLGAAYGRLAARLTHRTTAMRRSYLVRYTMGWMLANAAIYLFINVLGGFDDEAGGGVAWAAHMGGFFAGLLVAPYLSERFRTR